MKMLTVSLLVCAMMAVTRVAGETASCPSGWTAHNSRCFLYVPTLLTWADAEMRCQSHGGNLASVHNFDEHHTIQSMILRVTNSYPLTWIGGFDAQQEGSWFWSDGTPFTFTYWASGQPDNHSDAHCLGMNFGDQKKFDDQLCINERPFVCAKKQYGATGYH